jgi:outer membrane protein
MLIVAGTAIIALLLMSLPENNSMKNTFFFKTGLFASTLVAALLSQQSQAETLAEIFALAQKNDAVIRSQEATYMAGQETQKIARSALLPQIGLGASVSKGSTSSDKPVPLDYDTDTNAARINASQTIFNLEYWHNYVSGKKISSQAEAQFRSDQQALIVRVVQAYTAVLNAVDAYNTAKAQEAAIGRQLDQTKQRFDVGLVAITDVYEAQASFDDAAVSVLNTKGAVGIAFEALDNITGSSIQVLSPLSDEYPIKNPEPAQRDEWVSKALANNADLQASSFAKDAALENAKAKRAAHFPTLTATYQYNNIDSSNSPGAAAIYDSKQTNDVLALNLSMPLFAGGGISATRRQAWDQYNAADERNIYAQRSTIQATRSYYLAVTTGVARVAAQKQAIISAQSALDATNAGYEAGTRNIVDVLGAERNLYNSQYLWSSARYQYINDLLNLNKISGDLVPASIENANQYIVADKQIVRAEFDN